MSYYNLFYCWIYYLKSYMHHCHDSIQFGSVSSDIFDAWSGCSSVCVLYGSIRFGFCFDSVRFGFGVRFWGSVRFGSAFEPITVTALLSDQTLNPTHKPDPKKPKP